MDTFFHFIWVRREQEHWLNGHVFNKLGRWCRTGSSCVAVRGAAELGTRLGDQATTVKREQKPWISLNVSAVDIYPLSGCLQPLGSLNKERIKAPAIHAQTIGQVCERKLTTLSWLVVWSSYSRVMWGLWRQLRTLVPQRVRGRSRHGGPCSWQLWVRAVEPV